MQPIELEGHGVIRETGYMRCGWLVSLPLPLARFLAPLARLAHLVARLSSLVHRGRLRLLGRDRYVGLLGLVRCWRHRLLGRGRYAGVLGLTRCGRRRFLGRGRYVGVLEFARCGDRRRQGSRVDQGADGGHNSGDRGRDSGRLRGDDDDSGRLPSLALVLSLLLFLEFLDIVDRLLYFDGFLPFDIVLDVLECLLQLDIIEFLESGLIRGSRTHRGGRGRGGGFVGRGTYRCH